MNYILGTLLVVFVWAFLAGYVMHKVEPDDAPTKAAHYTGLFIMLLAVCWPFVAYSTWRDNRIAKVTEKLS